MEDRRVRIVRKPKYQRRDNPKARKVAPPPEGTDLAQVAESCRYVVDNPYHKARPGSAGTPPGIGRMRACARAPRRTAGHASSGGFGTQ